jgi:NhaP-type Na+/H+ or K+/H+ antiporter
MGVLSTDDVLLGLGLVVVLAIGSQIVARLLQLPAIVVLLPVGFVAGILTDTVHPDELLGQLYQPFVSLAVGVILFEAGLRLSLSEISRPLRRLVGRLVGIGILVTSFGVAAAAAVLIDGVGVQVAIILGAILVVSGPTVVLPLLAYARPAARIRSLVTWEGVLVDPAGALLGVFVFHGVLASGNGWRPGSMLASIGVGAAVGIVAAGILWLLLVETQRRAPRQAIPAVLMMVAAALVGADLLRDDSGFVATTLMGMVLANQRRIDVSLTMEFQGTLVQILIGILFVLIAASVTPSAVESVLPGALVLVAVMAFVIRPLAVALATWGSDLELRERAFIAWMAPRGIVAGATASAFGIGLSQAGIPGAEKVLPVTFVVIFCTVVLYGLTATPVARLLGVAGHRGPTILVVGGSPFAREAAAALQRAGARVNAAMIPATAMRIRKRAIGRALTPAWPSRSAQTTLGSPTAPAPDPICSSRSSTTSSRGTSRPCIASSAGSAASVSRSAVTTQLALSASTVRCTLREPGTSRRRRATAIIAGTSPDTRSCSTHGRYASPAPPHIVRCG